MNAVEGSLLSVRKSEMAVSEIWPYDKKTAILGEDHCRQRGACEGQERGALRQKQGEPQSYQEREMRREDGRGLSHHEEFGFSHSRLN